MRGTYKIGEHTPREVCISLKLRDDFRIVLGARLVEKYTFGSIRLLPAAIQRDVTFYFCWWASAVLSMNITEDTRIVRFKTGNACLVR